MSNWVGADYAEVSSLQQWMARESLSHVGFVGKERILDIGCGDGRVSAALAERLPRGFVLAIDPAPQMVRFACSNHHRDNLAFALGDARSYQSPQPFDWLVSFNALHWICEEEQPQLFAHLKTLLVPGGRAHLRFVPGMPGQDPPALEDVIEEVCRRPRWHSAFAQRSQPFCHPTLEQCRGWAEAAGFAWLNHEISRHSWDFGSRAEFVHFAQVTFVGWTELLPQESRLEFIDEVLDSYDSDRVFTFDQIRIELQA